MTLLLDGKGRAELRRILLEGFDRNQLVRALAESDPAREFEDIVPTGPFKVQVSRLIDDAERNGWLGQFEQIVKDELPAREDLQRRLKDVLELAAERGRGIADGSVPPGVALRGRMLGVSGMGALLGLGGALAGLVAWLGDTAVGTGPLLLGVVSLFLGLVFSVLFVVTLIGDRLGDRSLSLLSSRLPLAALAALLALAAVNGYWAVSRDGRPNFILQLVDEEQSESERVVNQPVHLVELAAEGDDGQHMKRVTDLNGQAFFTVRLGSGLIYTGGVEITEDQRTQFCAFPAFAALEARSIVQDLAALRCVDNTVRPRDTPDRNVALRVATRMTNLGPLNATARGELPRDRGARAERAPLGVPDAPLVADRHHYSLGYDPEHRAPLWTAFIASGPQRRGVQPADPRIAFRPDPDLPAKYLPGDADYESSSYRRGGLVPMAYTSPADRTAVTENGYFSASVPLAGRAGKNAWTQLSELLSSRVLRAGPVYVTTGPVYHPRLVIGPGQTQVPIALFQILLRRDRTGNWRALGFVVANDGSVADIGGDPGQFLVPIPEIERRSGLTFFPDLPAREAAAVKSRTTVEGFTSDR